MDFAGKVAIVTGAASGMGLLFAQNWAELDFLINNFYEIDIKGKINDNTS